MLPQSELLVLSGVGHIAFEEMPEICNRAMRQWLTGSMPSAPAFNMRYDSEPIQQLKAV